jgi:hypothetical protein
VAENAKLETAPRTWYSFPPGKLSTPGLISATEVSVPVKLTRLVCACTGCKVKRSTAKTIRIRDTMCFRPFMFYLLMNSEYFERWVFPAYELKIEGEVTGEQYIV